MQVYSKIINTIKIASLFLLTFLLFSCSKDLDIEVFASDIQVTVEAENVEANGIKVETETKIVDHKEEETYKAGTELTLSTLDKVETNGEKIRTFAYWKNDKGVIISKTPETKVKVKEKSTFTAVYLTHYQITFKVEGEADQVKEYDLERNYNSDKDYSFNYDKTGKESLILDSFYFDTNYKKDEQIINLKEFDSKKNKAGGNATLYGKYYNKKTLKINTHLLNAELAKVSLDLDEFVSQNKDELTYEVKKNVSNEYEIHIYYAEIFKNFQLPNFKEIPGIYQKGYKIEGQETYLKEDIDPTLKNALIINIEYEAVTLTANDILDKYKAIDSAFELSELRAIAFGKANNKLKVKNDENKVNLIQYELEERIQGFKNTKTAIVWSYYDKETKRLFIEMRGDKLFNIGDNFFKDMTNIEVINMSSWKYNVYIVDDVTVTDITTLDKYKNDDLVQNFNYGIVNNYDYSNLQLKNKTNLDTLFSDLSNKKALKVLNIANLFFHTSAVSGDITNTKTKIDQLKQNVQIYGESKTIEVKEGSYK